MSKLLLLPLVCSIGLFGSSLYQGSTLATVVISGAVIKTSHIETTKKYERKNCPVCKGKGWYLSGDTIKKVDCGYCEPGPATSIMLK